MTANNRTMLTFLALVIVISIGAVPVQAASASTMDTGAWVEDTFTDNPNGVDLGDGGFTSPTFLRTNGTATLTATWTELAEHTAVDLDLHVAQLGSLDPRRDGDIFSMTIDGQPLLGVGLGFGNPTSYGEPRVHDLKLFGQDADEALVDAVRTLTIDKNFDEHVYDFGALEALQAIPHTGDTLTLTITARGGQGWDNEAYAIDNLELSIVEEAPVPLDLSQVARLTAADGAAHDSLGRSVAVDGDTMVVGSFGDDDAGPSSGSAYVFVRSEGVWVQEAKLTAGDAGEGDYFGAQVAIAGDTVVVGAPLDDDHGQDSGSAYVFTRGADGWSQEAKLTAPDGGDWHEFGGAIAVDGERVVIGADRADHAGPSSGSAYVFVRSAGAWMLETRLAADDGGRGDAFGSSVTMDGDIAVVGAARDALDSGSAYVFVRSNGLWVQEAKLTADDGAVGDSFGASVAIDGHTLVVGAYEDVDAGFKSGSVYVFNRNSSGWSPAAKLLPADGADSDYFGLSVDVDGGTIVAGAYGDDDAGSAYAFVRSGGVWTQEVKLVEDGGAADDAFGVGVAVDHGTLVVGARGADNRQGSAVVFASPPVMAVEAIDASGVVIEEAALGAWRATASVTLTARCTDNDPRELECPGPVHVTEEGETPVTLIARDRDGNIASRVLTVRLDRGVPTIQSSRDVEANHAGWANKAVTVSFHCDDDRSGIDTCTEPTTVNEGKTTVEGAAVDVAGNRTAAGMQVWVDQVAPTLATALHVQANQAGWHNRPVTVAHECADALSGIHKCSQPVSVDTDGTTTVPGYAVDLADNATENETVVRIDQVKPTIEPVRDVPANDNGWTNQSVTVSFDCADDRSGVASCADPVVVDVEGTMTVKGVTFDVADNRGSTSTDIAVDLTAPIIAAWLGAEANDAGWHNAPVTVSFDCADALSGLETCSDPTTVETDGTMTVGGLASDRADNTTTAEATVRLDTEAATSTYNGTTLGFGLGIVPGGALTGTATDATSGVAEVTVILAPTQGGDDVVATAELDCSAPTPAAPTDAQVAADTEVVQESAAATCTWTLQDAPRGSWRLSTSATDVADNGEEPVDHGTVVIG